MVELVVMSMLSLLWMLALKMSVRNISKIYIILLLIPSRYKIMNLILL